MSATWPNYTSLGRILPLKPQPVTIIWHPCTDRSVFMSVWGPGRRLWNPSAAQEWKPFERWAHTQAMAYWLWFGQRKQKQLCTSANPTTPLFGLGLVTSIVGQGAWQDSSPHVYQVVDIQTLVLGTDPEAALKLPSASPGHGLGAPECRPVKLNRTVNSERALGLGFHPSHSLQIVWLAQRRGRRNFCL